MMNNPLLRNAATYGLILGLVTIGVSLLNMIGIPVAISIILWMLKLSVTITICWRAMKKQSADAVSFSYNDAIVYGLLVGLFSGIVYGTFSVLQITVIAPDLYEAQLMQIQQIFEMQGLESFDVMSVSGSFPFLIFLATIFYYALLGLVYSLIMGTYVKHPAKPTDIPSSE